MTAPDDHFDLDAAAEIDEGLDDGDARLAHAAHCDECHRRLAQVRTTRALLSALPDESMPSEIADRLHAALPREPGLGTIVPVRRRRRWASSPALAGLAAAAAAIALVAAISIGSLRSSDDGGSNAGDDAGAAAAPLHASSHFPVLASGAHYNDSNAAGLVATLDGLVRTPPTPTPGVSSDQTTARAAQKDTITLSAHASVPGAMQQLFGDREQILACVRLLAGAPVTPLAVDFARFTGGQRHLHNAPAMIVLLPAGGGLRDSAFIVGPKCTTDPSQDLYTFVQPT